jgi:hypothetical protein
MRQHGELRSGRMPSFSPRKTDPNKFYRRDLERLLRVDLDPAKGEQTTSNQALEGIRQKLGRWRLRQIRSPWAEH